jgi:mono/diheme cytochrome c family protein
MRETESPPVGHHRAGTWHWWVPLLTVVVAVLLAPLAGVGADAATGPDDELLAQGADVYSSVCAACHQAGGVGVSGSFPPLLDNPNTADAAYVEGVIRNGRTGEIVVNGTTYNGVMPAQSTLSDDDIAAVIAYIQSGFAAPAGPVAEVSTGPVAGTELPLLANYAWVAAFLIAIGLVALVLGPRIIAVNDRRTIPWTDAWMKTGVIVVGTIVATVYVPNWVLERQTVQDMPRMAQDLIAVGIWSVAIAGSILALWYAHREKRI